MANKIAPTHLGKNILSKADLVALIQALTADLARHPEKWENNTLERFLIAMGSWIDDSDAYFHQNNRAALDPATCQILADVLMAARVYE
jgi:hypothetical protein